jgi:hypothetical protein
MDQRPPVILTLFDYVYLVATLWAIEAAWSMFGFKQKIGLWLPVNSLGVPVPIRPDFRGGRFVVQRKDYRRGQYHHH